MTVDEAIQAASSLLDQRGQLLNGHLLRLVEGDKKLFRIVRERLIADGIAEDRSGVGLVRPELSAEVQAPVFQSPPSDWWLMKSGKVLGPMELEQICQLCRSGELESADVIRHGDRGLWKPLDSVPEVAYARLRQGSSTSGFGRSGNQIREGNRPDETVGNRGSSEPKDQFVFPEKNWSIEDKPQSSLVGRAWNFVAGFVGGTARLLLILFGAACIGGIYYWWQMPPSNDTIIAEFTSCRKTVQKLRERRVGRAEWATMEDSYRPRIEAIVNRLKPYANEKHPVEHALYLAGNLGLLPMLDVSADPIVPEQVFDKQMAMAKPTK